MADVIGHVSDTAFGVAYYRAQESKRTDALFRDPFAGILVGDRGRRVASAMPLPSVGRQIIVLRTCIIDDFIRFAIAQGTDTVLNLGAGLDTRPYRMELPGSVLWVEADYAHVIEFKEQRLAAEKPSCRLKRVKLDLADLLERRKLFADTRARAKNLLVVTEGVLPYLSAEEVGSLADDLKTTAHARYWIAEYISPQAMAFRKRRRMDRKMQNAPFKFTPRDWFGFFAEHGWRAKEVRYLGEEADRLKRPLRLPLLLRLTVGIQGLVVSREGRAIFKRFQAYTLFEPRDSV